MNSKETSILIVDDDKEALALLSTLLASHLTVEHTCVRAESADAAIELLEASFFHVMITDIQMPGRSGLELCQLVHQSYPNTVVVMISGMTDIDFAIEAMRAGAFDYLTKPITIQQLVWSVERALKQQELLMQRHYCEQSLEEEIRDLLSLNSRLRMPAGTAEKSMAKKQGN